MLRLNSFKGEEVISVLGKVILATVFVLGDDGDDYMGPIKGKRPSTSYCNSLRK